MWASFSVSLLWLKNRIHFLFGWIFCSSCKNVKLRLFCSLMLFTLSHPLVACGRCLFSYFNISVFLFWSVIFISYWFQILVSVNKLMTKLFKGYCTHRHMAETFLYLLLQCVKSLSNLSPRSWTRSRAEYSAVPPGCRYYLILLDLFNATRMEHTIRCTMLIENAVLPQGWVLHVEDRS